MTFFTEQNVSLSVICATDGTKRRLTAGNAQHLLPDRMSAEWSAQDAELRKAGVFLNVP